MIVELGEPRLSMLRGLKDVLAIDGGNEDVAAIVNKRSARLITLLYSPARNSEAILWKEFSLGADGAALNS